MKTFEIIRIKQNKQEIINDYVTEEITLAIDVDNIELVNLLCSSQNLNELVTGYLYTSGIISKIDDIVSIEIFNLINEKWCARVELKDKNLVKDLKLKEIKTSGCGSGFLLLNKDESEQLDNNECLCQKIKPSAIHTLMKEFQSKSEIFNQTGGVHSSAIVCDNKIIAFMEDIGRHNAIDKVIGYMLTNNYEMSEFTDNMILTSGRVSSEILHKVLKSKISVIISRSAPTNMAIEICRQKNITLVGFARGDKMNIYSGSQRIATNYT